MLHHQKEAQLKNDVLFITHTKPVRIFQPEEKYFYDIHMQIENQLNVNTNNVIFQICCVNSLLKSEIEIRIQ